MARPFKCRRIGQGPEIDYFKPVGMQAHDLEVVALTVDEFEALRLADLNGLYQEDAAKEMEVSRQTFGNILNLAHSKVADALVNAKAIRIEGGYFEMARHRFRCRWDGHEWDVSSQSRQGEDHRVCPKCRRTDIEQMNSFSPGGGRQRCRRGRGQGWRKNPLDDTEPIYEE